MNLIQFQNKFSEICKNDPNHIEGYSVSFTTEGGKPHITIKQGEIQLDYGMEMPVIAPDAELDADYLSRFHESLAAFGGSLQGFTLKLSSRIAAEYAAPVSNWMQTSRRLSCSASKPPSPSHT